MDVTSFRELPIGKVPVQNLFLCTYNSLEAHHVKVLDGELLDNEVTQELVKLDVEYNIRGGCKASICFFGEYNSKSLIGNIIPCLVLLGFENL